MPLLHSGDRRCILQYLPGPELQAGIPRGSPLNARWAAERGARLYTGLPGTVVLTLLAKNAIPRRAVIVAGGLLVLVVLTGTAIALWLFRSAALATAEWDLKNIAVVLAEQTRQGMLTVD